MVTAPPKREISSRPQHRIGNNIHCGRSARRVTLRKFQTRVEVATISTHAVAIASSGAGALTSLGRSAETSPGSVACDEVDAFDLDELVARRLDTSRHDFAEFLRADTLSLTIAFWPAGSRDDQTPHSEDEVYYVAAGRGNLHVAEEDRDVSPGTVVYVPAGVDHRFDAIEEDLRVLVFWSPPRHSRGGDAPTG